MLETPSAPIIPTSYSEYSRNGALGRSVRTANHRYVEWRDQENGEVVGRELYDHGNDPGENVNVAGMPAYADALVQLSELLEGRL